jgi:hypothetical protein
MNIFNVCFQHEVVYLTLHVKIDRLYNLFRIYKIVVPVHPIWIIWISTLQNTGLHKLKILSNKLYSLSIFTCKVK